MNKENKLETMRHSCAHILAAAVLKLYPKTKLAIGPATEDGFYYDFDFAGTDPDLEKISPEMQKIIDADLNFNQTILNADEAKLLFKNQPYKLELIDDLLKQGETDFSVYESGDFIDLCSGPHIKNSKQVVTFKLLSLAGAYWRGSEKNKMLTRIYGTCFASKKDLDTYLWQIEESKKRDHRKIGKELDLFSVDDYVGPGLVLWHPKLSVVREEIELFWRKEHRRRGYQYVYTPHIGQAHLWQTSGHLGFFKDSMFPPMKMSEKAKEETADYFVKPMNCPFHIRIYKSRPRSYKELPIRWCELGNVYRYEESGVLHGMLRVRGFTQDDAHIICREDQFIEEVNNILDFALDINKSFGFNELKVYLSVRGEGKQKEYVGEKRIWDLAEKTLQEILEKRDIQFAKDVGGAKFYGPAIDLKAVDAMGRQWQGTTIQLDMNLPTRFEMNYIDKNGKTQTPIMLHRTLLGSMERFVATLTEQYAGAFPVWLAPVQAIVIPISEKHLDYANSVYQQLRQQDIRTEIDDKNETIGNKIRNAEKEKIPFILVVGDRETKQGNVSVRARGNKDLGAMSHTEIIAKIKKDIEKKI